MSKDSWKAGINENTGIIFDNKSSEAQKNAAVEPLIEYVRKVDNMGNTRGVMKGEDGKKIPKPANQQHKLIHQFYLNSGAIISAFAFALQHPIDENHTSCM